MQRPFSLGERKAPRAGYALAAHPIDVTMESIAVRAARLGRANGFDLLRLALALAVFAFHSFTLSHGEVHGMIWQGEVAARLILPGFFAVSGYLVAGSLARCTSLWLFLGLRVLRIVPALAVVTMATALVLGPLFSDRGAGAYFADPAVPRYLRNILLDPQYVLPGLFESNVRSGIVNGALWTIPLEMACYGALALLAAVTRGRALTPALLTAVLAILLLGAPDGMPPEFALSFLGGVLLFRLGHLVPMHGVLGAVALLAAFWLITDPARGSLAVLPMAYGAVWLGLHRLPAWMTRADYSYGLYLAGFPLQQSFIHLFPHCPQWWMLLAAVLPLALGAAALLWHGVENPLLSRKHEILARLAPRPVPVRAGSGPNRSA